MKFNSWATMNHRHRRPTTKVVNSTAGAEKRPNRGKNSTGTTLVVNTTKVVGVWVGAGYSDIKNIIPFGAIKRDARDY